jgi:hypothetical protein
VIIKTGARVFNSCNVGAGTIVGENVIIRHHTELGEKCHIGPMSTLYSGVVIGKEVHLNSLSVIGKGGRVADGTTPCCVTICGSRWSVHWWDTDEVGIGCQTRTFDDWIKAIPYLRASENLTDALIEEYTGYLHVLSPLRWKPVVNGRVNYESV